jgi:hypothetical protein
VLAVIETLQEYRVNVRRWDRGEKGQGVDIGLRQAEGSYAIDIHLLRITTDDQPAGVFVFHYFRETDELVRLVTKLAEMCGPLVLWHDSGCEPSVLVTQAGPAEQAGAAEQPLD